MSPDAVKASLLSSMSVRDEIPLITDELRGHLIVVISHGGTGQSSFGVEIALVINLIDFGLRAWDG